MKREDRNGAMNQCTDEPDEKVNDDKTAERYGRNNFYP